MKLKKIPHDLTYEQFKTLSEEMPTLNENCVYELECFITQRKPKYPKFIVTSLYSPYSDLSFSQHSILLFRTFEDAEARMKEIVSRGRKDIYSFRIIQLPFDTLDARCFPEVSWLYDPDGTLLDFQALPPISIGEKWKHGYFGRTKERIRFRKGDIVEFHDRSSCGYGEVALAVVLEPEADVDYCWKHYRKCVDNGSPYDLGLMVLVGLSSDPDDLGLVEPLDLMKPRFPISDEIREMFMQCQQNFKKDE